jgi:predicted dehydrogenase
LKVCIVGAGQIAEAHIEEVQKIKGATIVGLCDLRKTPAQALADKYNIAASYVSIDEMLEVTKPDVVHITTPPGSHFFLALKILEAGSSVYIEKPVTLTAQESEKLIAVAKESGLKLCPGTHRLRSFETIEVFKAINEESRFGEMIHMDAVFGYNLNGIFGKLVTSNPDHWIAKLPGQLFQNNISHPIAMLTPFLSDDLEITSFAFDRSNNGVVNDELRVQIFDRKNKITCSVLFTSSALPVQFVVRYFGSKSTINLNLTEHFWMEDTAPTFPGGLGLSLNIRARAKKLKTQYWTNFKAFWLGRETFFSDMKRLVEEFYQSIETKTDAPIPYNEIQRTSNIIDKICQQISSPGGKS